MSATVRVLRPAEADTAAPALQELISELSPTGARPDTASIAERIRDERVLVLIAERDGVIVGTATLSVFQTLWKGMVGHVDDVVVAGGARGEGIGRRLMQQVREEASQLGLVQLDLTSRPSRQAANALYSSLGYERRDTNVYRLRMS